MVVDDSVVIRGLISRWIAAEPDMVVAASLRTGLDAVNQVERVNPYVAVLDIEMPELDGISALPRLLAKKRNLIIIMASTLTTRGAEIALRALRLGVSDYVPKPSSIGTVGDDGFKRELLEKVKGLARMRRRVTMPARARSCGILSSAPARSGTPSKPCSSPERRSLSCWAITIWNCPSRDPGARC